VLGANYACLFVAIQSTKYFIHQLIFLFGLILNFKHSVIQYLFHDCNAVEECLISAGAAGGKGKI